MVLKFTSATGYEPTNLNAFMNNYKVLLANLGYGTLHLSPTTYLLVKISST